MAIQCPYCKRGSNVQNPKPGQFKPKCPRCGRRFVLIVPKDPTQAFITRPLEGEAEGPAAAVMEKTPDKTSPKKPPTKPTPEPDPSATGAYQPPEAKDDPQATTAPPSIATKQGPEAKPTRPGSRVKAARDVPPPDDPQATGAFQQSPETSEGGGDVTRPADKKNGKSEIPSTLGGYQVIKELGRGGMGAVYLGRQISLDRRVALKVMRPELAHDPQFVARFTREAYAAAQLAHHNVVQIYDIGAQADTHFFSMEFVPGKSFSALLEKEGKLDPEVAAGYILQAARGLKFGHDLGMVHRDVKPDNMMLNDQGIVKVTDLGLVKLGQQGETEEESEEATVAPKLSGSHLAGPQNMTRVGVAVGTPMFMAPEQGRDSAHVDLRADIYSLGCTFYILLTGQPPFSGKTTLEVLSKHATAPLVPPEMVAKRVPKELSAIVTKMMAKKVEERYADMADVIADLEKYLGIQSAGPFSPREEHASALEAAVQGFNESPRAKQRKWVILGFFGACALAVLVCLLIGRFLLAGGFLGLAVLTPLSYLTVVGITEKTHLFLKFRELVFGSRIVDWLWWTAGAAFVLLILYLLGLLWVWLGFCVAAALLAFGFHYVVDRQVAAQREAAIEKAEKLFRDLRLRGLDEETLRRFVSKYSGKRWEEFYETLFGYEAKLQAREWDRTEASKAREKFTAWRDPLIEWMNAKQQARREAKEKKLLQAVEEKSLKAKGMDASEARRKAQQMASVMVEEAAEIKAAEDKRARMRGLLQAARRPQAAYTAKRKRKAADLRTILNRVIGARTRFVVGAALLAGCALWANQNDLISTKKLDEAAKRLKTEVGQLQQGVEPAKPEEQGTEQSSAPKPPDQKNVPLKVPFLPDWIAELFNSWNPGVAGLILIVSALYRGWKIGLAIWPAALIAFIGDAVGVPGIPPLNAQQSSMGIGTAVAVVGWFFLRNRR